MRRPDRSLWEQAAAAGLGPQRILADACGNMPLAALALGSTLGQPPETLRGRAVLVSSDRQLPAALALIELDGIAGRLLLCPPDLDPQHVPALAAEAGVDVVVSDGTGPARAASTSIPVVACGLAPQPRGSVRDRIVPTEWLLFTSGTTGRPKLVLHSLSSLTGPLQEGPLGASGAVWGTFYDIRRYGGLQVLLRSLLGGGALVLSQAGEPITDFLRRAGRAGVTHMLGTPSHWRRVLMSPAIGSITPRYVRLSGEIADQAILNQLAAAFPDAALTHAYASTEAGVGFEVTDGREGFPAALLEQTRAAIDIRIVDGTLRLRSPRTASRYLGGHSSLADADGFVDTGDIVVRRGDRYGFAGRREGVINVGGQKVHPEEVEAVINRHPGVRMAKVRGRPSPITGAIVVAEIVLSPIAASQPAAVLQREVIDACRDALPPHKVPVTVHVVASLTVTSSGKLERCRA